MRPPSERACEQRTAARHLCPNWITFRWSIDGKGDHQLCGAHVNQLRHQGRKVMPLERIA